MISIRAATPDDAPALAALRWEFRSDRQLVESEQDFFARCTEWMRRELHAEGRWRAWIAENDGRPVGQIWFQLFEKLPNPNGEGRRHGYVSNLYVQPAARGGVGAQLLDAALGYASAHGVDRILLWPSARSQTLYRRRGFTRDAGVFELKL